MKKKLNFWWIIAGVLGILLVTFTVFYFTYNRIVVKPNKEKVEYLATLPTATPTPDPLAAYSILLLGYGGANHEGGWLTDSIMVTRIDPRKEEVSLISIPRDLWVEIPIEEDKFENRKINEAYAIGISDKQYPNKKVLFTGQAGGGEMAKAVVEKVVGFKIDYFATIDFDGFVKIVDILGGINIRVERAFDDPKYPIEENIDDNCEKSDEEIATLTATMSGEKLEEQFSCRYEELHFDRGVQIMDGTTALKFSRSRHSPTDGGDFNRAARQRLVLTAIRDRIINIGFISKIIPTVKTLTRNIRTDIGFGQMGELLSETSKIAEYELIPIALTDKNVLIDAKSSIGQFIFIPKAGENNWKEVQDYIESKGEKVTSTTIQE